MFDSIDPIVRTIWPYLTVLAALAVLFGMPFVMRAARESRRQCRELAKLPADYAVRVQERKSYPHDELIVEVEKVADALAAERVALMHVAGNTNERFKVDTTEPNMRYGVPERFTVKLRKV